MSSTLHSIESLSQRILQNPNHCKFLAKTFNKNIFINGFEFLTNCLIDTNYLIITSFEGVFPIRFKIGWTLKSIEFLQKLLQLFESFINWCLISIDHFLNMTTNQIEMSSQTPNNTNSTALVSAPQLVQPNKKSSKTLRPIKNTYLQW